MSYRFFDRRSLEPSFLFNTLLALFIISESASQGCLSSLVLLYIPQPVVIILFFSLITSSTPHPSSWDIVLDHLSTLVFGVSADISQHHRA